jgi:hypothetical protein
MHLQFVITCPKHHNSSSSHCFANLFYPLYWRLVGHFRIVLSLEPLPIPNSCDFASKVSTPNCDVSCFATPIFRPKWDTTCLQFRHKWSKVTNDSWGVFWGSQWELKHVVLEGVQIRTRLVPHLDQPILWTSTIHHLLWVTLKIMKPLSITSSYFS